MNKTGKWPYLDKSKYTVEDEALIQKIMDLPSKVGQDYEHMNFSNGLVRIFLLLNEVNKYFSDNEPWKLVNKKNQQGDPIRLNSILYISLEATRISCLLLYPIIPHTIEKFSELYLKIILY